MNDDSLMPFGKHKGKPMSDVPVEYLHWYFCANNGHIKDTEVGQYIINNLDALKMENKDLIWN